MSFLFQLSFYLAAPFWALMIVAPRWSWTTRIVGSPLIIAPVALLYLVIAVPRLADLLPLVTGPTRRAVAQTVAELVERGARLTGEIEQDGGTWTAVCDSGGAAG
jgi:membrane protein implicated in regulation of membrane protease activity